MIPRNFFFLVFVALIIVLNYSCFDRKNYTSNTQAVVVEEESTMTELLTSTFESVNDSVHLAFRGKELETTPMIKKLYAENQYLPIWTTTLKPNHKGRELMRLFAKSAYYGLDTSFYQFGSINELYDILNEESTQDINSKALEYELLLTHNCFKMMSHLKVGLIRPDTSIYGQHYATYPKDFPRKLGEFINSGRLTDGMLSLQPKSYQYRQLQKGLERFLSQMALRTDSFSIPDPAKDSVLAYNTAKEILTVNSFYKPNNKAEEYAEYMINEIISMNSKPVGYKMDFDTPMEPQVDKEFIKALKGFQKAHGLFPDGKIGANTKNALLKNNRERFEQIAINLERLKWEKRRPARYVYVNLPSYKVRVIDKHMIKKTYIVVVGAPWFKTPLLNSKIEYFTTNPKWYVPVSITRNEILPRIKNDSTYLARHGYRVYDLESNPIKNIDWAQVESGNLNFRLQQNAGRGNAMGLIKYYFDSGENNILLHDTNDKSKFSKEIRAYSHGCIRLGEPIKFGTTLVGLDQPTKADSVAIWVNQGQRIRYHFKEHIPLYIRYVTCEADSKANITFYHDVYGKDKELKEQLFAHRNI